MTWARWGAKKNKYRAIAAKATDGRSFHSKLERSVYEMLKLRQRAKEIQDLECQVQVRLTDAQIGTKVDFAFTLRMTGERQFAEAKGFETERWLIIRKLWKHYGPAPLEIWTGTAAKPRVTEIIVPTTWVSGSGTITLNASQTTED
jgi:hypothetical protein